MTTLFIDGEPQYFADGPPGPFVPLAEADAMEARIAALVAERDGLAQRLKIAEEVESYLGDKLQEEKQLRANQREVNAHIARERKKVEEALKNLLHIFDRELPENSIGRQRCDEARTALGENDGKTEYHPKQ